ncbi:MAG: DUF4065 domain-containing protein [Cellulomonadaceae bacterium]|jgi:uncharacterized phage-associated protein|nr:DUF4065 domain-containing protein [Cellulomonadaceae bacterium]
MTAMKLEKLVYYSQAWHLVWEDTALFSEHFEAWNKGPVAPALQNLHRGQYIVTSWPIGDSGRLSGAEIATVDSVVGFYGAMSAEQLSSCTHNEAPWIDARAGLPDTMASTNLISTDSIRDYYSSKEMDYGLWLQHLEARAAGVRAGRIATVSLEEVAEEFGIDLTMTEEETAEILSAIN